MPDGTGAYLRRTFACFVFAVSLPAFAAQFGSPGFDGQRGTSGTDGRDGPSREITADGETFDLDLAGSDGSAGYDGSYGGHASGCSHGTPAYNLQGASGGDGGSGGRGGRGGDGGDLTIYYENISNLKSVYVDASPGRGAAGGYGARGGRGCRCRVRSWEAEVGDETRTFYCTDGRSGRNGSHGRRGGDGETGSVKIISQLDPLKEDVTHRHADLLDIEGGRFTFGKNQWEQKSGARDLLASGSVVQDRYWKFMGRIERAYGFVWDVDRPLSDFEGTEIVMNLNEDNEVTWDHSDGFWHAGHEVENEDGSVDYVFSAAATAQEAYGLEFDEARGIGSDLIAVIDDPSERALDFEHSVYISYATKARVFYYNRYSGDVPAELVEVDNGTIIVAVGQLPIDNYYLREGTQARIYLEVRRKMGNHEGEKALQQYHYID